jgi:hypothetical protein
MDSFIEGLFRVIETTVSIPTGVVSGRECLLLGRTGNVGMVGGFLEYEG